MQVGKKDIALNKVDPVGNYAVQLHFSDGHNTGIYSWDYLHELGTGQTQLWQTYLERIATAGASRDPK